MESADRIQAACNFILQSPPGEINDVLNDVRNIISDDELLHEGVLPALREYNIAQFMTVDVPGTEHQSIVSEASKLPVGEDQEEERFLDPRSKKSFKFDHLTLEASDLQDFEPEAQTEEFRSALETAAVGYLKSHYHDGVASAFSSSGSTSRFVLQIVANKYNPSNFWSGRWRSEYVVDFEEKTIVGKMLVNVHYYEQGNVQLSTTHDVSVPLPSAITPSQASAPKLLALIGEEESKYQNSLNDSYHEMREKTFKGLRRALPMTRSKVDWEKVTAYQIGAELAASKGGFGSS